MEKIMKILASHEKRLSKLEGKPVRGDPAGRTKPAVNPTIIDLVKEMKSENFFDKPRSLAEIVRELARKGHKHRPQSLSGPLIRAVRRKIIRRTGAEHKWRYVK